MEVKRADQLSSYVKSLIKTTTLRQTSVTFTATVINGVLGMLFYIFSARFLGPAEFGIMALSITIVTLISDIGDLGTDTGLVRFVAKHIDNQKEKAFRFLKLGLEIKLVVGLVVILIGTVFANSIATVIFNKPEFSTSLKIASFGVLFALLFSFVTHTLQSIQKFKTWGGILVFTNAVRLAVLLLLYQISRVTLENTLLIYILMPFVGFVLAVTFLLPKGFMKVKNEKKVAKEFFNYNKWVAAFTLLAAFGARLDTFLTARLLTAAQLGIYSAANQLVQVMPQFVSALGTVVAPKMGSMGSFEEMYKYLKKTQVLVLGIAFLGVLLLPVALYIIPLLLGSDYTASVQVFAILFFAMLIFLISVPIHNAIIYYYSYPRLFFWVSFFHLIIIAIGGWFLINAFGVIGAATVVFIGQVFNFVYPGAWLLLKMNKEKRSTINH